MGSIAQTARKENRQSFNKHWKGAVVAKEEVHKNPEERKIPPKG
jgi:hypothetical protein